jgi:putative tricarboxylic transport membrane protein
METFSFLLDGFSVAFTLQNITLALIGCFLGTVFGALPGLGPANGVAILIPISFSLGLDAASSMILLASVYYGAMYGGRISSILINIPGDEPALMTTLDGYPMTLKGRAGEALTLTGISSFFGAMVATVGLMFLAPQLVKIALLFGPAEYFALFVMAFATLGGVSSNNKAKTILASAIGLGVSTIGVDGQTGVPRLSFGNVHFYDGIDFLIVIVGMFAVSEIFIFIENKKIDNDKDKKSIIINKILPKLSIIIKIIPTMFRSSLLGFFCRRITRELEPPWDLLLLTQLKKEFQIKMILLEKEMKEELQRQRLVIILLQVELLFQCYLLAFLDQAQLLFS